MAKKLLYTTCASWILCLIFLVPFAEINAQSPGFFLDDWQEKTAELPASVAVDKPTGNASVNVTVDMSQVINKVPAYIYGNNAVTWDNGLRSNTTAMNDLRNLSPNVLRWPGGNLSNVYFWNVAVGSRPADIPADISPWYGMNTDSWQMSVDEYYDLLDKTNSTGIICVNYSYARYGTGPNPVATAAHMAAEWVRYDNGRTKFWELGNENYGNWQTGYEIDVTQNQDGQPRYISGQLYGQHCKVFIDSMRAAAAEIGSEIKIGAVAYDAETSHNQIFEDWNEGMMPELGDVADFMVVHSYFTPYDQNSTVSTILNSHVVPEEIMGAIESDMAEAGKPMIPVAMTEWNIFAVGSMQQVSYINGMLAAITLGEYVKHNYGMANRWDLVNGWDNGNDHGMFSKGGEPGVDPYNPRAVFFYMYYHQKFFGDHMVHAEVTGNSNVIAHTSTFGSGETGIVIVNKSGTAETVEIDLLNGFYGPMYYYYTLTGGTDNGDFSRKVLINGIETDEEGGGPDEYEQIPASATGTQGGIKVELPPLGVVFLMVEKSPLNYVHATAGPDTRLISVELTEEIRPISDYSGLEVLVNGSDSPGIVSVERDEDQPWIFHILLDSDLGPDDGITLTYSGGGIRSLEDSTLVPFVNEAVENLIPHGPFTVTLIPRERITGEPLEDCRVTFNNETRISDNLGQASFEVMEAAYNLLAAKEHFDTARVEDIRIISDTTIYIDLDLTWYQVIFHLTDGQTGADLSYVAITLNEETKETDAAGEGSFLLNAGTSSGTFGKMNYHSLVLNFDILSDTVIKVQLQRSHAQVKFRLRSGETPVNNALIILGEDSLYTTLLGTCLFESVPLNATLDYVIEREYYFSLQGGLTVHADTTMDLQMEKSVARIEFLVEGTSGSIDNGHVILDQDTADCDGNGRAVFYNLPINQEYSYLVESVNHEAFNGSLFLEKDTTVQILLTGIERSLVEPWSDLSIYPNPASDILYIESTNAEIERIKLVDITGKTILQNEYLSPREKIELHLDVTPGIYFLKADTERGSKTSRIIVRN